MTKVLMRGAKVTDYPLGIVFKNIRFNRNLLQRELGTLLNLSQSQISRIEQGKDGIEKATYDLLCRNFELTDVEKKIMERNIVSRVKRKYDPLKGNLGTLVKKIRERMDWSAYELSINISSDKCLIGAIESHNQPFKKDEIEKFIQTLQLNEDDAEELRLFNDYFEWQVKPNRLPTSQEKLITAVVKGAKFKNPLERREYIYSIRDKD